MTVDHGAAPLPTQVDVDVELGRVFKDVGTLPEMVTPVSDPEGGGGLIVTAAGYPVPAIPSASVVMTQPLVVTSPPGPADVDPTIPWVVRRCFRRSQWCQRDALCLRIP